MYTKIDLFTCLFFPFGSRKINNKIKRKRSFRSHEKPDSIVSINTGHSRCTAMLHFFFFFFFFFLPPCRWPSPVLLPQRLSSSLFPAQTLRCEELIPLGNSRGEISSGPFPWSLSSPPIHVDAWAGGADGGNWWWGFGDEIKIHRGSGGEGEEGTLHSRTRGQRAWRNWWCAVKATVSVSPERCLSKETALETCTGKR